MKKRLLILFAAMFATLGPLSAQKIGLKTNLLSDGLLSPNLGVEFGLSPRWTFDLSGQLNLWTVNDHKWKHWLVQPEARYWFCERFARHFLGFHAIGGVYNFGNLKNGINMLGSDLSRLTDLRYQGWGIGAGIGYGYDWILGEHWNLEAEIGIGWIYTRYDAYPCAECGTKVVDDGRHHYFGPTKAALSLVYLF